MSSKLLAAALALLMTPCLAQSGAGTYKGVVDQVESDYVLANAEDMKPIAVLEGVGFGKESFARFVGVSVEARGTMVEEKGRKVLRVRSIEDIRPLKPGQ